MASRTREELKAFFETGDTPTEEQFSDLIDSTVIQTAEAGEQNNGSVNIAEIRSPEESTLNITLLTNADPGSTAYLKVNDANSSATLLEIVSNGETTFNGNLTVSGNIFGTYPEWNNTKEYSLNNQTSYQGRIWKSVQAENLGNTPGDDPDWWIESNPEIVENYIDNPVMLVSERPEDYDSGPVYTPLTSDFVCDRWHAYFDENFPVDMERVSIEQPDYFPVGSKSIKMISTSADTYYIGFAQWSGHLNEILSGRVVTLSAWVKSNNANARLAIQDNIGIEVSSNTHSGGETWELLSVTKTLDETLNEVRSIISVCDISGGGVVIAEGDYIEVTGVVLNIGSERKACLFSSLLDEKIKCKKYYYIFRPEEDTRLGVLGFGRAVMGLNNYSINHFFHHPVEMVTTDPTITYAGEGWYLENNLGDHANNVFGSYPAFNQRSTKGFEFSWEFSTDTTPFVTGQMTFLRAMSEDDYFEVDGDEY